MENLIALISSTAVWQAIGVIVVFVLAGTVKGAIGLGLPTVSAGLLSLFMSPVEAAAMLIVPSFFTNVWQLLGEAGLGRMARRLGGLLAGACLGTAFGAALALRLSAGVVTAALGVALMAYAASSRYTDSYTLSARCERILGPLAGVATGTIAGATGVFVLPAVPFLRALGLPRESLMQAMGLSFTVSTIALAVVLGVEGKFHVSNLGMSCAALLPSCAGMWIGQVLRRNMDPLLFSRCFFTGLFLLGFYFALGMV